MQRYDVAVVGAGPAGLSAALILGRCGRSVLLCDSGEPRNAASLALHGFITRDGLEINFVGGDRLLRRGLFYCAGRHQHASFPAKLGCRFDDTGLVDKDELGRTCVPGVFVAGDAARSVMLSIVAAGEGAEAAFAINRELLHEDLGE